MSSDADGMGEMHNGGHAWKNENLKSHGGISENETHMRLGYKTPMLQEMIISFGLGAALLRSLETVSEMVS